MARARWCLAAVIIALGCGQWAQAEIRRGVVLAHDGSPARGAHVWVVKLWIQHLDRVDATADEKGRFSVSLGPGSWIFPASLGNQGMDVMDVMVAGGHAVKPLILRLTPQGRLRARLVEAETGKPIQGGRLEIDNGLDPTTDADGRFEVGGLSRSRYHESFVVAPGRERKRVLFEMSDKPVTDLEIPVARGGRATGRVLDLDGKPIPGAFVGRSTSGSIISLTGLWVRADGQGRFDLDGLVLDRTTWLNAVADGYESAQRDGVHCDAGSGPLTIEFRLARNPAAGQGRKKPAGNPLAQAAALLFANRRDVSGVVLDLDKKPVPGATVRWGPNRSDETIETRTGDDGKFRLSLVPDEPRELCVIPTQPDLAPSVSSIQGRGNPEVRIVLTKGHTARGVVCDDRGTPFAGVTVLAAVGTERRGGLALWERSTHTDERGRFVVEGLPAGDYTLSIVRASGGSIHTEQLKLAPGTHVERKLKLSPAGR
ncbi:MAG: carboxypeptidase regulatory-like domain-containing protein [Isosphaeraceae bacterium]